MYILFRNENLRNLIIHNTLQQLLYQKLFMKFAVLKERKNPPDRRVLFSPQTCKNLMSTFSDIEIVVESSEHRTFTDEEYKNEGIEVLKDVSNCDVMLGVKEVPIEALIPNKKYFFFSHTIKKQPYNRKLLQAILQHNIELYDHETIVDQRGFRLIGFGYYAGIVGAYNGFRTYGLKYDLFQLPKAQELSDKKSLIEKLKNIQLPSIKIVLTGTGRVGMGSKEILDSMGVKQVKVDEFLHQQFDEPVYVQVDVLDYNERKDGKLLGINDFFKNASEYKSNFMRFAEVADFYIAAHFWDEEAPVLFSREEACTNDFNIKVVADISCDIDGPIASTIKASTIADPIFGYDPKTGKEANFKDKDVIAVMSVDNLPSELPKDASVGFGEMFSKNVIPAFFNGDQDGVLERALITKNGKLTDRFSYLQDYLDGAE